VTFRTLAQTMLVAESATRGHMRGSWTLDPDRDHRVASVPLGALFVRPVEGA
jgi:hypothetical protein